MRINHNVTSINILRNLTLNTSLTTKAIQKLTSGLRINKAGDDAAGLAISEKMRGQIRGLDQASKNAQDTISLLQTAEGALNESHAILQRMRELAVQSANDTNTKGDRQYIQNEMNEMIAGLNKIAENTEFNTKKLLDGSFTGIFQIGANPGQNIAFSINDLSANVLGIIGSVKISFDTYFRGKDVAIANIQNSNYALAEHSTAIYTVKKLNSQVNVDIENAGDLSNVEYVMVNTSNQAVAVSVDGKEYYSLVDPTNLNALSTISNAIGKNAQSFNLGSVLESGSTLEVTRRDNWNNETRIGITVTGTANVEFEVDMNLRPDNYRVEDNNGSLLLKDSKGNLVATTQDTASNVEGVTQTWKDLKGENLFKLTNPSFPGVITGQLLVSPFLKAGDTIEVQGEIGIDVSSQNAADVAIVSIDQSINFVSSERSKLGSIQNRLEHTINTQNTSSENLIAAESRIRDADLAKEMMNQTKYSIIAQAAQAMLAQSNQMPQGVLQLLR